MVYECEREPLGIVLVTNQACTSHYYIPPEAAAAKHRYGKECRAFLPAGRCGCTSLSLSASLLGLGEGGLDPGGSEFMTLAQHQQLCNLN